jgi:hypothetical protein
VSHEPEGESLRERATLYPWVMAGQNLPELIRDAVRLGYVHGFQARNDFLSGPLFQA